MKKKVVFCLVVLSAFTFYGCKKYLDWNITDKGRKPVLNSMLITDSVPQLYLYESVHILDEMSFKYITNATVFAHINNTVYPLTYNTVNNYYTNDSLVFNENNVVKLTVQTYLGNIENTATIMKRLTNVSFDTTAYYDVTGNRAGFKIKLKWKDDSNTKNYYIIVATLYDDIHFFSIEDVSTIEVNGVYFLTDELFNGEWKTIEAFGFNYPQFDEKKQSGKLSIYLLSTDESAYKYFLSSRRQNYVRNSPFSEPVMVFSNVSNGYGIVGSYSIAKQTFYLP